MRYGTFSENLTSDLDLKLRSLRFKLIQGFIRCTYGTNSKILCRLILVITFKNLGASPAHPAGCRWYPISFLWLRDKNHPDHWKSVLSPAATKRKAAICWNTGRQSPAFSSFVFHFFTFTLQEHTTHHAEYAKFDLNTSLGITCFSAKCPSLAYFRAQVEKNYIFLAK